MMKYLLGKFLTRNEEHVDAKLSSPLGERPCSCSCWSCQAANAAGLIMLFSFITLSRLLPSPSGASSKAAGLMGRSDSTSVCEELVGTNVFCRNVAAEAASPFSLARKSLMYLMCRPAPRCPPTPDLRSSSALRTRQRKGWHLGSHGRSVFPLKYAMAVLRSFSFFRLTKAQFDLEMRNIEATPSQLAEADD